MVIKGKSVAGAKRVADHLARTDTNERMEVKEIRGVAAEDMKEAFREMEAVATGAPNCKKPFYHASMNTRADERLTDEQRMQAIDRLEKELGLDGQPRVVVVHEKLGREHCHVVWARVNSETMRVIPDSHNYRKHELVAREMEKEFGHERVQGAHIERDGKDRPERAPSHREHQQAERTGIKPRVAKAHITGVWRGTDSGQTFMAALENSGWILARGDRRDHVAVDPYGGVHSLARRIEGATAKDVRTRLADVKLENLPSVDLAKAVQKERPAARSAPVKTPRQAPGKAPVRLIGGVVPRSQRPSIGKPVGQAVRAGGKLIGGIANSFENLLGGGSSRPKRAPKGYAQDDSKKPLDRGQTRREDVELARQQDEAQKSAHRQKLLGEYSREVSPETEKTVEIEKGRERKRGE